MRFVDQTSKKSRQLAVIGPDPDEEFTGIDEFKAWGRYKRNMAPLQWELITPISSSDFCVDVWTSHNHISEVTPQPVGL
jgi:hypothetical protein